MSDVSDRTSRIVAGVMSGTSLDGVDVAVVRLIGSGTDLGIDVLFTDTRPFETAVHDALQTLIDRPRVHPGLLSRLHMRLAIEYARVVREVLDEAGFNPDDMDVVGCHGQTVFHAPDPSAIAGHSVRGTLQIGDPSALAHLLGTTVVGDLRIADMAGGGEGAPIVPYLDYCVLRSETEHRLALNIGGIANLTVLPAGCDRAGVTAFDTGPGNCLIDAVCSRLFDRPFDSSGEIAGAESPDAGLVETMLLHDWFSRKPPKSTGRELFSASFAENIIQSGRDRGLSDAQILASVTALTAASIVLAVERFVQVPPARLIVSGGGVHNSTLMGALASRLAPVAPDLIVESSANQGLDPDAKEAILCAVLAHEALNGVPTGMPSVTGADRPAFLGKICQGGHAGDSLR